MTIKVYYLGINSFFNFYREDLISPGTFVVIDVREDNEWNLGRIPTAIHLGKGIIERDIESVVEDRNAELILYCQGGFRSALAAESLNKMGYQNVFSMSGGFGAWVENEFSISQ